MSLRQTSPPGRAGNFAVVRMFFRRKTEFSISFSSVRRNGRHRYVVSSPIGMAVKVSGNFRLSEERRGDDLKNWREHLREPATGEEEAERLVCPGGSRQKKPFFHFPLLTMRENRI